MEERDCHDRIGHSVEHPHPIPAEALPAGKIHHNGW